MSKARNLAALLGGGSTGVVEFSGTGAVKVPGGTSAQRPTPANGQIRYNSDVGSVEFYANNTWASISPPPTIQSVSPTTYNGEQGTTFTLTGENFNTDATVKFVTNNGTEFTAATVTRVSSTQITATTPQDFTVAQEPLSVKVVQGSGSVTLESAIDCGGAPTWSTAAGSLATIYDNATGTHATIAASDPDSGATVAYSVASGALPVGVSLNANTGVISGDPADVSAQTTYNFTAAATDNAGNSTQRAFSIIVNPVPDGSTSAKAATSATTIKSLTGTNTDGIYWIKPTGGSGSAIQVYCIMSKYGGGWMKFLQYYGGTDMSNSSAINAGGAWCNAEINAAAGKLSNTDILAMQATGINTAFLFRVGGGSDNLLNNGSGTGKFSLNSGVLANWGNNVDPSSTYRLSLDMTSNDSFDYICEYPQDTQGQCPHTPVGTKLWYSDHNYNGSFIVSSPVTSTQICWSIGTTGMATNLHWMSGLSSQSGGELGWGNNAASHASLFIK